MTPGPDGAEASRREVLSRALVEEGDRLYALALRTTRDPDLAADAVQEAFASALEKADGFRGDPGRLSVVGRSYARHLGRYRLCLPGLLRARSGSVLQLRH